MRRPTTDGVLIYFGLREDPRRPDTEEGMAAVVTVLLILNAVGIFALPDDGAWLKVRVVVAVLLGAALLARWRRRRRSGR